MAETRHNLELYKAPLRIELREGMIFNFKTGLEKLSGVMDIYQLDWSAGRRAQTKKIVKGLISIKGLPHKPTRADLLRWLADVVDQADGTSIDKYADHAYLDDGSHDEGSPVCGVCGSGRNYHEKPPALNLPVPL